MTAHRDVTARLVLISSTGWSLSKQMKSSRTSRGALLGKTSLKCELPFVLWEQKITHLLQLRKAA
jgi:hypothetical protein